MSEAIRFRHQINEKSLLLDSKSCSLLFDSFDHQIGQASALQAVAKVKDKEAEARLMVRVCCAVGAADGDFDEKEKAVVRKICTELSLNPKDFDLA